MKNIIKVGILIIGILILFNSINNLEDLIREYSKFYKFKEIQNYTYDTVSGNLPILKSIIWLVKLIVGLVLLIKPDIINIYIPEKINSNETILTFKLVFSFIFCFAIYLIVFGSISVLQILTYKFIPNEINLHWVHIVPGIFKIIIGFSLYLIFNKEIYKNN